MTFYQNQIVKTRTILKRNEVMIQIFNYQTYICSLLRDIHFDYDSNQNRRGLLEQAFVNKTKQMPLITQHAHCLLAYHSQKVFLNEEKYLIFPLMMTKKKISQKHFKVVNNKTFLEMKEIDMIFYLLPFFVCRISMILSSFQIRQKTVRIYLGDAVQQYPIKQHKLQKVCTIEMDWDLENPHTKY